MTRLSWPVFVAIVGGAAIGGGSAVLVYLAPAKINLALSAAALAIASMLIILIAIRDIQFSRGIADAQHDRQHFEQLSRNLQSIGLRLDDIEDRLDPAPASQEFASWPEPSTPANIAEELENLRQTIGNFAAEHGAGLAQPAAEPPAPRTASPEHRLELYLEPLVNLATGQTAHYRAAIVLEAEDGRHVPYQELSRQLREHRLRPSLDLRCLARALPLTRKLAIKRNSAACSPPRKAMPPPSSSRSNTRKWRCCRHWASMPWRHWRGTAPAWP
jgi:hypothetical protein